MYSLPLAKQWGNLPDLKWIFFQAISVQIQTPENKNVLPQKGKKKGRQKPLRQLVKNHKSLLLLFTQSLEELLASTVSHSFTFAAMNSLHKNELLTEEKDGLCTSVDRINFS